MPVLIRGTATVASNPYPGTGGVSPAKPTGTVTGDVIYAFIHSYENPPSTPPSGWTSIYNGGAFGRYLRIYRKVVTGADSGTSSWAFTVTGDSSVTGVLTAFSGADTTTPEDVTPAGQDKTTSGTTVTAPSVNTATAGAVLLCSFLGSNSGASNMTWTPPSGMTELHDGNAAYFSLLVASLTVASPTSTGSKVATISSTAASAHAVTFAVRPAGTGTAHTRSVTDAAATAETVTRPHTALVDADDDAGLTDAATAGRALVSQGNTSTAGIADAVTLGRGRAVAVTDTAAGVDSAVGLGQTAFVDAAGGGDTVTLQRNMQVFPADAVAAADVGGKGLAGGGDDPAAADDAATYAHTIRTRYGSGNDDAGVGDSVTIDHDQPAVSMDLDDYQFVIVTDPVVPFGVGVDVAVENFDPGTVDTRSQDQNSATADATVFGTDRRTPPTWAWEMYTTTPTPAAALEVVQNLSKVWDAEEDRLTPGRVVTLRYKVAGRTRRVYGRPRSFAAPPASLIQNGKVPIVADFALAENVYYDDDESSTPIIRCRHLTATQGWSFPISFPLQVHTVPAPRVEQPTIGGNVPTWITLTIYGPVLNPVVTIGSARFALRGQIPNGQWVRLSGQPWDQGIYRSNGTYAPEMLDPRARLSQLRVPPSSPSVSFTGYDPTGSAYAFATWRNAHSSL